MIPLLGVSGAASGARAVGALLVLMSGVGTMIGRWRADRAARRAGRDGPSMRELYPGAELAGRRPGQRQIDDADLVRADLRRCRLGNRVVDGRDLSGSTLAGARGSGLSAVGAVFDNVDLAWASIRDADLRDARFDGANLVGADLRRSDLAGADLRRAAGVATALWTGCRADRSTRWPPSFSPSAAGVSTADRRTPAWPATTGSADPTTGPVGEQGEGERPGEGAAIH